MSGGGMWQNSEAIMKTVVLCNCGNETVLEVSRAPLSAGRMLHKCAEIDGDICNFFAWHDEIQHHPKNWYSLPANGERPKPRKTDELFWIKKELEMLKIKVNKEITTDLRLVLHGIDDIDGQLQMLKQQKEEVTGSTLKLGNIVTLAFGFSVGISIGLALAKKA